MDLPIVGVAWPEEHASLLAAARTLEVAVQIQGLRRAKPFITGPPK